MSQGAGVYPDLTVRQNLWYFGSVLGVSDERMERALEETDLVPQADQLASTLSGGQWSRAVNQTRDKLKLPPPLHRPLSSGSA